MAAEIDDRLFELINHRCDVVLASRSAQGMPSLCWAMAGRMHDDRRSVEVWVREDQARQLLADVRATGRVAATFCEPYTNVAVQFKGRGARVRLACADDAPLLDRHLDNMIRELARVQFGEAFTRAAFEQPWSLLAAVQFGADEVFLQTPGPQAGHALAPADGGGGAAA